MFFTSTLAPVVVPHTTLKAINELALQAWDLRVATHGPSGTVQRARWMGMLQEEFLMGTRFTPSVTRWLGALAAVTVFATSALAGQPWASIPSAVSGGRLTIAAGGLAPGQDVTLRVTDAHGQTLIQTYIADANGNLQASLQLASAGRHGAVVLVGRGRTLASGDLLNLR